MPPMAATVMEQSAHAHRRAVGITGSFQQLRSRVMRTAGWEVTNDSIRQVELCQPDGAFFAAANAPIKPPTITIPRFIGRTARIELTTFRTPPSWEAFIGCHIGANHLRPGSSGFGHGLAGIRPFMPTTALYITSEHECLCDTTHSDTLLPTHTCV